MQFQFQKQLQMKQWMPSHIDAVRVLLRKNSSAMLFVSAKVSQLALCRREDRSKRARPKMLAQMDAEGFGCTNTLCL